MTSNSLHCKICQVVLDDNESTIKQHISSIHLSYRPYECINCKDKGDIFNTATVDAMEVHISTSHCATNSEEYRVIKDKKRETELSAAIEECRRLSTLKLAAADTAVVSRINPVSNGPANSANNARVPPDLKENVRQVYSLLDGTSTNSENLTSTDSKPENSMTSRNAVQSEIKIIQIDDDGEQTEVKQEHGQLSQDAALGDVRPKLERNHNAPAIDQTSSEIIPNSTNESIDDNRTDENRHCNSESVSLAVKPEQTFRNVVNSEIEIIQIDDDDEQTEGKRKCLETLQDIALEIVRPELDQNHSQNHNAPAIAETCVIIMTTDQASDNGDARLSKQNEVHIAVDSNVSGDITATATSMPIPTETPPLKRAIMPNMQIRSKAAMPPIALQKPIRDEEIPLKLRLRYRKRIRYGVFEGHTETKRGRFSRENNSLATSIDDGQNKQRLGFDESSGKRATNDEQSEYRLESESDGNTLTIKTRSHDNKKENRRKSHKDKGQGNSVQTRTHARERPFKCKKCNYSATKRYTLIIHERTHCGEKSYKCQSCIYATARSSNLIRHNRIHSGEKPFKCRFCKFATAQSSDLIRHNRIHSGEKPFKCRFCKFASARSSDLIKHNRIHSGEKPFKCRFCKFATAQSCNLIRHNRSHIGEKPFKCRYCQFASRHNDSLNRHMNTHHKEFLKISVANSKKNTERNVLKKSGLKAQASYATANSKDLIKHNRIHSGEKPFKCRLFKFATAQSSNLIRHNRIHSGEKPFKCRICKFATAQSSYLIRHNRSHIGEKPFKCRYCQFASRHNDSLNRHMNTHHKEFLKISVANSKKNTERNVLKKSGLKAQASYATANSKDLIKHNRIHSGEKPFKCRLFKFATAQSSNLIRHNRIHSGEKPFKCRICKFATAQSSYLIRHNRSHIGEKPFKCRYCQFASRHNDSLNRHMKIHHKGYVKISADNSKKNIERNKKQAYRIENY